MTPVQHFETFSVGVLIGFLGGLFGKGGSAVATPLLKWIGLPGYIAVASPLPATFPSTLIAAVAYLRAGMVDWEIVGWGISVGVPATVLGAFLSQATGVEPLLILTALLIFGFGISFVLRPTEIRTDLPVTAPVHSGENGAEQNPVEAPAHSRWAMVTIAAAVGFISGLLANSGGLLLAPLYARVLRVRLKVAFACSLLVSAALSVPGTIVHWYLGHISWKATALVASGSIPFAYVGAALAVGTSASRLERWYGFALTALGLFFLLHH